MSMLFKRIKYWATSITTFRTGDVIPVDGPNGTAKMGKDDLLQVTAQNALAGNIAPEFDPTRTSENPYLAGQSVVHNGVLKTFKVNHYGEWDENDMEADSDDGLFLKVLPRQIFDNNSSYIRDLNDVPANSVLYIQKTSNTSISNLPAEFPNNKVSILLTVKEFYSLNTYQIVQVLCNLSNKVTYRRSYNSGSGIWSSWTVAEFALKSDVANAMFVSEHEIFDDSSANLSDLNDAEENTSYVIQKTANTQTLNFPTDYADGGLGVLTTYKTIYSGNLYVKLQTLLRYSPSADSDKDVMLYRRSYNSGNNTWSSWVSYKLVTAEALATVSFVNKQEIYAGSSLNLGNLNDAEENTTYVIQKTAATTTLNFPTGYANGGIGVLSTYKVYYGANDYQKLQMLYRYETASNTVDVYRRSFNSVSGAWGSWSKQSLIESIIKVGQGQQFTTLRSAFEEAFEHMTNAKILVLPGTYDLTVEFADILDSITTDVGLKIGHGMHVIFADGAKVTANFVKGNLTDAQWLKLRTYFAPFWCRQGDFVIENLNIEANDCRYCVHDERGNYTEPYVHKFINCKMKKTSTTSDTVYAQCIGGGLGSHGTIVVEGGYYESNPAYGGASVDGGDPSSYQCCISYHNDGYDSNAESSVTIKDVYLANRGYVAILNYGTTTKKTVLYISGCSQGLPPQKRGANNTALVDNTDIVQWCNETRNAEHWEAIDNYRVDLVDNT